MMRVLVTGANGFIGQAICHELMRGGFAITAAVRQTDNEIFSELLRGPMLVQVGDIGVTTDWNESLKDADVIIHLAARVHVMHESAINTLQAYRQVNVLGTERLARAAAKLGIRRFIFLSSIKVNGEVTQGRPFSDQSAANPRDLYAVSKWEAEQLLGQISNETGMEIVIVRSPLVYGPHVKANFLKLLRLLNRGIPLPIAGVRNLRSLIYVGNLVDALIACATHPAAAGQTYLVSDGEDVSTPQLVQKITHALHKPNRIFPVPVAFMRGAAKLFGKSAAINRLTQSLVIDSSKIRKDLGRQPPYTMAQGLQATAEWYLQLIKSRKV